MHAKTSKDEYELAKFARLNAEWWSTNGALKTLHDINPARINFIKNYTGLKDKRLLDVGCGGGILSEGLARLGAKVTGIDAENSAIEVAKAHALWSELTISYQTSTIEDYTAEPFDIISCMELLEHVQDPLLVLEHCKRLLKPEGFLFLSTINRGWKAYLSAIIAAEYVLKLLPKQTHDYKKFLKPSELSKVLRSLGFEILSCKGLSYNPFSGAAEISASLDVNYMIVCRKG